MRGSPGLAAVALALIALGAPGCRVPGKTSPPTSYWVLAALPGAAAEESRHVVGIGPFEFPAYLERSEIVTRVGDNQLRVSEFDRWGEKLGDSFAQTLARNLEVLVPGTVGVAFPWKGPTRVQYRVTGAVTQFEVVDGRAAQLEASWTFTRVSDGQTLGRGSWAHREPLESRGTDAGVAALSRALAALSREIAKPLAALE